MNTAFKRLVWKEYRAQRTLWLFLLMCAFALYAYLRSAGAPISSAAGIVVIIFGGCFIIAELAIAFAGEVDEGTAGLLRMLPCRTLTLMFAKLSAAVGGYVLLLGTILLLCAAFEFVAHFLPEGFKASQTFGEGAEFDWYAIGTYMTLFCSTSLFASLISRKVISAVGKATLVIAVVSISTSLLLKVLEVITGFGYLTTYRERGPSFGPAGIFIGASAFALFGVSTLVLSRPWHRGRLPWSWSLPNAVRDSADRRLPSFTRLWHAWLARVASKPMSQRRVFSMLLWRECCSAIPFAITWLMTGVLISCGRLHFRSYPWPFVFLIVFIHECGQRTMREDQRSGAITLLANIGVSAKQVWWSKTVAWLSAAIIGTVCLIAVDYSFPWHVFSDSAYQQKMRIYEFRTIGLADAVRIMDGLKMGSPLFPATTDDRWLQAGVCLSVILGLFSIGQLTATWIQRQVLAFSASLVLTVFAAFILLPKVILQDWLFWIAVVPIPFCLFAATANTARQWIDRVVTWRLRIKQTAWLVVALLMIPMLGWFAWFVQPALALAEFNRQNTDQIASQNTFAYLTSYRQPQLLNQLDYASMPVSTWSKHDEEANANCWHEFLTALKDLPERRLLTLAAPLDNQVASILLSYCQPPAVGPNDIQKLLKPFQAALERDNTFPQLPIGWTAPWSETPAAHITAVLLEDARVREADGDVNGAVQQMVRAIKLCRLLSVQTASWQAWFTCLDAERVALGRLRLLLGTADLSSLDLESLFVELTEELIGRKYDGRPQFLDIRPMLHRRTVFYRIACVAPTEFFAAIQSHAVAAQPFTMAGDSTRAAAFQMTFLDRVNRIRAFQTMLFSEALLVDLYQSQSVYGKFEFFGLNHPDKIAQLKRFLATSSIADMHLDIDALSFHEFADRAHAPHIDTIASERATLLTIKLQQYRLEHSEFPESLMDLLDDPMNSQMFTDPYTGSPFFYTPKVVDKLVRTDFARVSHRPEIFVTGGRILACFGPRYSDLDSVFRQTGDADGVVYLQLPPNLILFVGLHDRLDWRLEQIATPVTPTNLGEDVAAPQSQD